MHTPDMRARPATESPIDPDKVPFAVEGSRVGPSFVVHVRGELDVATRDALLRTCLTDHHEAVVVEMADMSFMDCSGYGSLVAARQELQLRHGSLTLINQSGQPAQLLALISALEQEMALSES